MNQKSEVRSQESGGQESGARSQGSAFCPRRSIFALAFLLFNLQFSLFNLQSLAAPTNSPAPDRYAILVNTNWVIVGPTNPAAFRQANAIPSTNDTASLLAQIEAISSSGMVSAATATNIAEAVVNSWTNRITVAYIAATNWTSHIARTITSGMMSAWDSAYVAGTNWLASVSYGITAANTNDWTQAKLTADAALPASVTNGAEWGSHADLYPRNNPSNYVTQIITNGLLGAEADTLQTVMTRGSTGLVTTPVVIGTTDQSGGDVTIQAADGDQCQAGSIILKPGNGTMGGTDGAVILRTPDGRNGITVTDSGVIISNLTGITAAQIGAVSNTPAGIASAGGVATNAGDVSFSMWRFANGYIFPLLGSSAIIGDQNNGSVFSLNYRELFSSNGMIVASFRDVFRVGPDSGTNIPVYVAITNLNTQIAALTNAPLPGRLSAPQSFTATATGTVTFASVTNAHRIMITTTGTLYLAYSDGTEGSNRVQDASLWLTVSNSRPVVWPTTYWVSNGAESTNAPSLGIHNLIEFKRDYFNRYLGVVASTNATLP